MNLPKLLYLHDLWNLLGKPDRFTAKQGLSGTPFTGRTFEIGPPNPSGLFNVWTPQEWAALPEPLRLLWNSMMKLTSPSWLPPFDVEGWKQQEMAGLTLNQLLSTLERCSVESEQQREKV